MPRGVVDRLRDKLHCDTVFDMMPDVAWWCGIQADCLVSQRSVFGIVSRKALYFSLSLGDRAKIREALLGKLYSACVSLTGVTAVDRRATTDCRTIVVVGPH